MSDVTIFDFEDKCLNGAEFEYLHDRKCVPFFIIRDNVPIKNSDKYIFLDNFDMEEDDVIFLKFTNSSLYNNCVKNAWQKIRR